MSGTTTNLELFKYNPNTDGDQTFNIDNALNNNFDKLDTVIGALANLTTEQKTSLVTAINEIITNLDEKSSVDLDNLSAIGQGILDAKIEAEALTAQNGYIKFKLNGISNLIINWARLSFTTSMQTFNLPHSHSDTNYKIIACSNYGTQNINSVNVYTTQTGGKTASQFKYKTDIQNAADVITIGS